LLRSGAPAKRRALLRRCHEHAARTDFTGDEATVDAALTLVTVAANLGEHDLIARSDGGDAPRWLLTGRH
jgi:hypothetical protein